jgi:membrane associated rhomboid family serine protease
MMIPLGDGQRRFGFPFATLAIVVLNAIVFGYEISLLFIDEDSLFQFINTFGTVPFDITHRQGLGTLSALTATFIHGSPLHILGNMVFLWVFGRKVEDLTGSFNFLFFYLLCGVLADVASILSRPESPIPGIGASGAVSGVMAAYMLFYLKRRVRTLIFIGPIPILPRIPAGVLIGYWLLLQALYIELDLSTNVDYWAHVGGFGAGLMLVFLFLRREIVLYRPSIHG